MNAAALLAEARRHGATLAAHAGRLLVEAPAPLPDALLTKLRACKPELLALLEAFEARRDHGTRRQTEL